MIFGMSTNARVRIEPMTPAHWQAVHRIYVQGIATGNATLEREAPDWDHFDRSHRQDCRFVACSGSDGAVLGWIALSAVSARRVYLALPGRASTWRRRLVATGSVGP